MLGKNGCAQPARTPATLRHATPESSSANRDAATQNAITVVQWKMLFMRSPMYAPYIGALVTPTMSL